MVIVWLNQSNCLNYVILQSSCPPIDHAERFREEHVNQKALEVALYIMVAIAMSSPLTLLPYNVLLCS